jgi:hypothetical protein
MVKSWMMKRFSLKVVSLALILNFMGCNKLFPPDKLSLQRIPYSGKELRIDGYYYRKLYNYNEELLNIHFFYSTGIVRYGGGGSTSFEEVEERILNNQIVPGTSRTDWGVFHVKENTIKFEMWYPSSGGGAPVYVREGMILNDTTFHIIVSYRSNGKERNTEDEMYHFRKFSPKPDSTNNFIP